MRNNAQAQNKGRIHMKWMRPLYLKAFNLYCACLFEMPCLYSNFYTLAMMFIIIDNHRL